MDFEGVLNNYKSGEINREEVFLECENLGMFEINENGEIWKIAYRYGNKLINITPRQIRTIFNNGSIICCVYINKHYIGVTRSRIIWTKYIGRIPDKMRIIHKNGVYNDDRISNLDIMKNGEVQSYYEKFDVYAIGEKNSRAKFTNEQCLNVYERLHCGESAAGLAREYDVSLTTIYNIKSHNNWGKVTNPKKRRQI